MTTNLGDSKLNVLVASREPDWEWVLDCPFDPPHQHIYPADWEWSGPDELDPRADPRFKPDSYYYFDNRFILIHVTSAMLCDDEAIDNFTNVANYGPDFNPKYLQVRRNGSLEQVTLPVVYNADTDEVFDNG